MTTQTALIDHIRKRPGMYIGPTDQWGIYRLVQYACGAALHTTHDYPCSRLSITIAVDGSIELVSDGRYAEMDDPAFPASLTQLATDPSTEDWDASTYIAILNALTERFRLELFTGVLHVSQTFAQGRPLTDVVSHGSTSRVGRRFTFVPDRTIFDGWETLSAYPLLGYLRTCAVLNAGLRVAIQDQHDSAAMEVVYPAGIRGYLAELTGVHASPACPQFFCRHQTPDLTAEVALQWCHWESGRVWSYVNGHTTLDGGSHVSALRQGLAQALDRFARQQHLFGDDIPRVRSRDLPPTLAAIINVQAKNPQYSSATRERLGDRQIERFVRQMLIDQLPAQFTAYPDVINSWATWHARSIHDSRGEV